MRLVALFFSVTYVACMALHDPVVIKYSTSVIYGIIATYLRVFFTLRCFFPCTSS